MNFDMPPQAQARRTWHDAGLPSLLAVLLMLPVPHCPCKEHKSHLSDNRNAQKYVPCAGSTQGGCLAMGKGGTPPCCFQRHTMTLLM